MDALERWPLYVNGAFITETDAEPVTVFDPAHGTPIAVVPTATDDILEDAIGAAERAFPSWARTPARERAQLLWKAAGLMRERQEELARLLTREQGKPLAESRGEIAISAEYLEWNAEEGRRAYGDTIPSSKPNQRLYALRQPVGVAAAITPWNFPSSMITRKIGPALAAGCTVIVKPASATPLSAIALMKIFAEAGFPDGVVNLVLGPAAHVADVLVRDSRVRKLSFTGSTEVGKTLMAGAAATMKKVSLELGGHAPFLVFDDADLDLAASGVIASKYRNAGQTCICANRLYVQRGVVDRFSDILAAKVQALRVGDGLEPGVEVGPLIDERAVEKVERHVNDAVSRGGRLLAGGERLAPPGLSRQFFAPTLVLDPPRDVVAAQEETFGPLMPMWTFDTEEEAVALANNTPYGLASYFFARDIGRIIRVSEGLEYGIVGANEPVPTVVQAPFGGVKESGVGREGGHQGLDEYLYWKYVALTF
ncbi:MAG: NAD-dependent succinate-semialdehyde dehydrogenase [Clostridia bacterium]